MRDAALVKLHTIIHVHAVCIAFMQYVCVHADVCVLAVCMRACRCMRACMQYVLRACSMYACFVYC